MGPILGLLIKCPASGPVLCCTLSQATQSWTLAGSQGPSPPGGGRAALGPASPSCRSPGGSSGLSDEGGGGAGASQTLLKSEGTGTPPLLHMGLSLLFSQAGSALQAPGRLHLARRSREKLLLRGLNKEGLGARQREDSGPESFCHGY